MSTSTDPLDSARRVARTIVQTGIPTFIAVAVVIPPIVQEAHGVISPDLYATLVATAGGITATAALLSRIMALPAVNTALRHFKLEAAAAHTPIELDTQTRILRLTSTNSGEFTGAPAR